MSDDEVVASYVPPRYLILSLLSFLGPFNNDEDHDDDEVRDNTGDRAALGGLFCFCFALNSLLRN